MGVGEHHSDRGTGRVEVVCNTPSIDDRVVIEQDVRMVRDEQNSAIGELSNPVSSSLIKSCAVCNTPLEYLDNEEVLACYFCGGIYKSRIWCPEGHFVCQTCHHMPISSFIEEMVRTSLSKNPVEIATVMMLHPSLKWHSCEHAWVFTTAVLIAVKNEGTIKLSHKDILSALGSVKQQANPELVHTAGMCSIVPAVGVAFHTLFNMAYGKSEQDDITMKVVAQAISDLADNSTRCRCCKSVVLTTLDLITSLIRARFDVDLEGSAEDVVCDQVGAAGYCEPSICQYYVLAGN
ncbi:MAG TPA: DUF5714 domain-containing protein [Anaerolineae bacterium]|nr:DUF5714 domain-containing protein [Anaerolineae bacterium]